MPSTDNNLEQAAGLISKARSISVLTGAGVSAESGVPTFRGSGGMWKQFRAEDLATPQAFLSDPRGVWEWYDWRRTQLSEVQPNAGHHALVELERRTPRFTLITQNVDELHRRAGSQNVLEIHGSIWIVRCTGCEEERHDVRARLPELPPVCRCGAIMRPGVVWFGEGLPQHVWHNAEEAVLSADLLLVIGTSAVVHPAASLVPLAKRAGAAVAEINLEETPLTSEVDVVLRGGSAVVLPRLLALLNRPT